MGFLIWEVKTVEFKELMQKEKAALMASIYPGLLVGELFNGNQAVMHGVQAPKFGFGLQALKMLICPYGYYGIITVLIGINVLYYAMMHRDSDGSHDEDRNLTYSEKGTYGTSGWMSKAERDKVLHLQNAEDTDEIILGKEETTGKVYTIPNDSTLNKHISVYGASGTRKTRGFVRPYMMQSVKRSKRVVLQMVPGVQATKQQELDIRNAIVKSGAQFGRRDDGSYVIPIWDANKVCTMRKDGSVITNPVFADMECEAKVETGESMLVTDPKGELYESMAPYLESKGYDVKLLDIKDANGMVHSDSWNCLAEIEGDDLNAQIFADTIIKNTAGKGKQDFWSDCEMNLLKALCLYVERNPNIPTRMCEVYNLITKRRPEELDAMFAELPFNDETQAAKSAYSIYQQANDNVKGGVIIGLGSRLQVFQGKAVQDITNHSEINLRAPGKRKCAYFCVTSDQQSAFDFLAALFYSMLFVKLVSFADSFGFSNRGSRMCWVPVNFVLDEFPNIASISDFTKKISTVRSRGINISVIFQNLAQLQNRYPYGQWEEILGNCDTNLFLGCTDATTAKYISDRTGLVTVGVSSQSKNHVFGSVMEPRDYKESDSIGKRQLLTPDEVLRIPKNKELILLRGQKPFECDKFDYSEHPDAKLLRSCSIMEHIPKWKSDQQLIPNDRKADPVDSAFPDTSNSNPFENVERAFSEGVPVKGKYTGKKRDRFSSEFRSKSFSNRI